MRSADEVPNDESSYRISMAHCWNPTSLHSFTGTCAATESKRKVDCSKS